MQLNFILYWFTYFSEQLTAMTKFNCVRVHVVDVYGDLHVDVRLDVHVVVH